MMVAGRLDKALAQTFSGAGLKNIAIAGLAGGLTSGVVHATGLGNVAGAAGSGGSRAARIGAVAKAAAEKAAISASVRSLVTGQNFGKSLEQAGAESLLATAQFTVGEVARFLKASERYLPLVVPGNEY